MRRRLTLSALATFAILLTSVRENAFLLGPTSLEGAEQDPAAKQEQDLAVKNIARQQLIEDVQQRVEKAREHQKRGLLKDALNAVQIAQVLVSAAPDVDAETKDQLDRELRAEADAILNQQKRRSELGLHRSPNGETSEAVDIVRGKILRSRGRFAEFTISIDQGLYIGDKVSLVRSGQTLNTLIVDIVDSRQAVGRFDEKSLPRQLPQPGDDVVFFRRRPSVDLDHPANSLIGKRATMRLTLESANAEIPVVSVVRVLGVALAANGRIDSVRVVDEAMKFEPKTYKAKHLLALVSDTVAFVRDEPNGVLVTRAELAAREDLKKKLAEAARLERRREEEESRAHLITAGNGSVVPAPGYEWLTKDVGERRVRWSPGIRHPKFPHVIASSVREHWEPAPGYEFVKNTAEEIQVRWSPGKTHPESKMLVASAKEGVWSPERGYEFVNPQMANAGYDGYFKIRRIRGIKHPELANVVTSSYGWEPAPGYEFVQPYVRDPERFGVRWIPGKQHPQTVNVVASSQERSWMPAPGYMWIDPADAQDIQVKWVSGLRHPKFRNIVASSVADRWEPAPGYQLVKNTPDDIQVRWCPGIAHPTASHVVALSKEGSWGAASGYQFANNDPGDLSVVLASSRASQTHGVSSKDVEKVVIATATVLGAAALLKAMLSTNGDTTTPYRGNGCVDCRGSGTVGGGVDGDNGPYRRCPRCHGTGRG